MIDEKWMDYLFLEEFYYNNSISIYSTVPIPHAIQLPS